MSGPDDSREAAPIDRAALAEISRGDQAVERRLLSVFQKANAADAGALKEALEQRDVAAVIRAAHRVVGASKMAGAITLAAICESIAQAGKSGDWNAIVANRDALYFEFERVNDYLCVQIDGEP